MTTTDEVQGTPPELIKFMIQQYRDRLEADDFSRSAGSVYGRDATHEEMREMTENAIRDLEAQLAALTCRADQRIH